MKDAVAFEDLRDAYLLCRTIGHAWFPASSGELGAAPKGHTWFPLNCERCTTKRIDLWDGRTGEVADRKYHYPEGYEINETVVRSQLRSEWERRRAQQLRRRNRRVA